MGKETALRIEGAAQDQLNDILRSLAQFLRYDPAYKQYYYFGASRHNTNPQEMPDAAAAIEPYGIYFCDYGGEGRQILAQLTETLRGRYGDVRVEDVE